MTVQLTQNNDLTGKPSLVMEAEEMGSGRMYIEIVDVEARPPVLVNIILDPEQVDDLVRELTGWS